MGVLNELALYKNYVCIVDCYVYESELVYILCTAKQSIVHTVYGAT